MATDDERSPDLPPPSADSPLTTASQRILLLYSLLAGLSTLIPVPFLDDFAKGLITRRMMRQLLATGDLPVSESHVTALSRERIGCPLRYLYLLIWYPIKKLIRTVVFVLAFKTCIDVASHWLHRGYLVAAAVERGHLTPDTLARPDGAWPTALAIEEAVSETDTSPVDALLKQIFVGSRDLLWAASRDLSRRLRAGRRAGSAESALEAAETAEADALGQVLAEMAVALRAQLQHLQLLEARYMQKLPITTARMTQTQDAPS
ncbi:MAG: hypothetical protein AAFV53_19375 [Myxococcota bacterium]